MKRILSREDRPEALGECPQENEIDGLVDAFEHNKRKFRQIGENLEMN